jgi:hypothetical protein
VPDLGLASWHNYMFNCTTDTAAAVLSTSTCCCCFAAGLVACCCAALQLLPVFVSALQPVCSLPLCTRRATFKSPNIASRVSFSIGTDAGSIFDATGGAATSSFNNFRRVVCDMPEPATLAELGPPWLTAVLYPAA